MENIVYEFEGSVYLNLTNKCPCNCDFCLRNNGDQVGDSGSLWLSADPTYEQVLAAVNGFDFGNRKSVVVCGYGEPTCALDNLLRICRLLKDRGFTIRLNTNGLSDLINGRETAAELCEVVDTFSISLNAPTAEKYDAIVHSDFGLPAFDAMLRFAADCKACGREVKLSVVDVIGEQDIAACRQIADRLGIPLRVREYID